MARLKFVREEDNGKETNLWVYMLPDRRLSICKHCGDEVKRAVRMDGQPAIDAWVHRAGGLMYCKKTVAEVE